METTILILAIMFSISACMTGSFGLAGMGSSRNKIRGWAIPFFIAALVSAYLYAEWAGVLITLVAVTIVFSIMTKIINNRHHGLDFDKQSRYLKQDYADEVIKNIAKKQKKQ